jgi:hypothetical protein
MFEIRLANSLAAKIFYVANVLFAIFTINKKKIMFIARLFFMKLSKCCSKRGFDRVCETQLYEIRNWGLRLSLEIFEKSFVT